MLQIYYKKTVEYQNICSKINEGYNSNHKIIDQKEIR
jgi:hypothetical protein